MKNIKKILFVLYLITLLSGKLFSQVKFDVDDNLNDFLKANPPKYKTKGKKILDINEGQVDFYKYKRWALDSDIKILMIKDKYAIGILELINNENVIFLDMDGDGYLDSKIKFLVIPHWVVADNSKNLIDKSNNNIKGWLDKFESQFNSNINPYSSGNHLKLLNELLEYISFDSTKNKDLLYSLYLYYLLGQDYPWAAYNSISYLTQEYVNRFSQEHVILYLHTLESLINLGKTKEAVSIIDNIYLKFPNFIPGKVYKWQFEENKELKQNIYNDLKKNYPQHWIVIQI